MSKLLAPADLGPDGRVGHVYIFPAGEHPCPLLYRLSKDRGLTIVEPTLDTAAAVICDHSSCTPGSVLVDYATDADRILSQPISDNSLSSAPPPISEDDWDSGLGFDSSIYTGDPSSTDSYPSSLDSPSTTESSPAQGSSSNSMTLTDDSETRTSDNTDTTTPVTTTDPSTTSSSTSTPTTVLTSTSATSDPPTQTSSSLPGLQTDSSHDTASSKNGLALGGIIAISILLLLMAGAGGYILWRWFRSRRRISVVDRKDVSQDASPITSFAPMDHSAAVPLFTESARSSGEVFSPTAANALPGSARFPLGYDKPLPPPPNPLTRNLPRLITKGKRPVYNSPIQRISISQSARPSPLRRQFSFDLEDAANNEVLRSAGLTTPASGATPIDRSGPLNSNPVDEAEIRRLSAVSADTGSRRSSLNSLPESLRVRPGSI
ncbi:MAG: hypothetical protein Q9160_006472 [Pyrenula sp. 1 TL-2023]